MTDAPFYTIVYTTILALITLAYCAFIISGRADDAEQQAPDDGAEGDWPHIPVEITSFHASEIAGE